MALAIVPFTTEHRAAAALLAARHRRDRAREPELPPRFEDVSATRLLVDAAWSAERSFGAAAIDRGEMVGYVIARIEIGSDFPHGRSGWVSYEGHAVARPDGGDLYRALYAMIARRWIVAGCIEHYVSMPASDREALAAWCSVGFGRQHTRGLRDTAPVQGGRAASRVSVHSAGSEEIEIVFRLQRALGRHHAAAPVFAPYAAVQQTDERRQTAEMLSDAAYHCLLALDDGDARGMIVLAPPRQYAAMMTPERAAHIAEAYTEATARGSGVGSLLLDAGLAHMREDGAEHCTVSWWSANLAADRFWRGHGFRPMIHRLLRSVDPRIVWAGADRDGTARDA